MKMTNLKKLLSLIACFVLIAATALFTIACSDNTTTTTHSKENDPQKEVTILGEGVTKFNFTVTDTKGNESFYEIHTDKKLVGDALFELNLIDGDEDKYGLYVKTVCGTTLDYNKDGKYWAFYANGKHASKGVSSTEITEGATYSFKAE